ncbi:hypothetical protein Gain_0034_014 [Komagataeibacter intermedius TF2]|nr:hypothetical protein Gain_0034_014 [Komagataeibacter intermedius TF2]
MALIVLQAGHLHRIGHVAWRCAVRRAGINDSHECGATLHARRPGKSVLPPHSARYHGYMTYAPLSRLAGRITIMSLLVLWLAIMAHDPISLPFF